MTLGEARARPVDVVVSPLRSTLLIGSFDGVHRRSIQFIEQAIASNPEGQPSVAIVVNVIGTSHLTTVERSCELLVKHGVDSARAVTIGTPSGLETLCRLIAELRPTSARIEPDLEAGAALLVRVALDREVIPLDRPATTPLDTGSASMIGRAIRIGDIPLANHWLGRPHRLPVTLQSTSSGPHIAECLDPEAHRPLDGTYIVDVGVGRQRRRAALAIVDIDTFTLSFTGPSPQPHATMALIDFIDRADTESSDLDATCGDGQ